MHDTKQYSPTAHNDQTEDRLAIAGKWSRCWKHEFGTCAPSNTIVCRIMKIEPDKGIHWPTMIADVAAAISFSAHFQMFLPNLPFLIRAYFPDVCTERDVHL